MSTEAATATEAVPFQPRSKRGRKLAQGDVLTPLAQIRVNPHNGPDVDATGAWAYFIRPDGETIRDALVLSPNGGIPEIDDQRKRARFGANASYYRERARAKGLEYIGPVLTPRAVERLVEVIIANREEGILFAEDEIANCTYTIENSDRPEVRDQARKRRGQFQRRLEMLQQPLDAEEMARELNEIAQAQELASLDPKLLRVMERMMGQLSEKMLGTIRHFQAGKPSGGGGDDDGAPRGRRTRAAGASPLANEMGDGFIDAD